LGTISYKPAPGENQVTEFRGIRLEAGKSVKINDPRMLSKLEGHPQFDVQMDDKEREAAQSQGPNPLAGAVFTSGVPSHQPYYSTGGGAAATDDQEALGAYQVTARPPSTANAAGGGLHGSTLGDEPTPEQILARYGTSTPTDSMEPGEPRQPSELKGEIQQVQAQRAEEEEQRAAPRPRGRPRRSEAE
jgi:hypothetical protein